MVSVLPLEEVDLDFRSSREPFGLKVGVVLLVLTSLQLLLILFNSLTIVDEELRPSLDSLVFLMGTSLEGESFRGVCDFS